MLRMKAVLDLVILNIKKKKRNNFFLNKKKQLVICLHNSLGSKREEKERKTIYNKK